MAASPYAIQATFEITDGNPWLKVRDGDPTVRLLFDRHYSRRRYRDGRSPKLFVGPGQKMVLRTVDGLAMFAWRKFIDDSGQQGVNCAAFRNESPLYLSSDLIRSAVDLAGGRWPGERMYTYVNAQLIRSTNPGYCFKRAGWTPAGVTKGGLVILELDAKGEIDG